MGFNDDGTLRVIHYERQEHFPADSLVTANEATIAAARRVNVHSAEARKVGALIAELVDAKNRVAYRAVAIVAMAQQGENGATTPIPQDQRRIELAIPVTYSKTLRIHGWSSETTTTLDLDDLANAPK